MRVGQTRKQMKLTHGKGIIAVILGMQLQMGNNWGGVVNTFDTHGIQGRLIAEYYEQRKPKGGCYQTVTHGWQLKKPLWHDLMDFHRA